MNNECVVITNFAKDQPGYLDFSYRVKSLVKRYKVTLVSNSPLRQSEMQIEGVDYVVYEMKKGRLGWLIYLWECARLIRKQNPGRVVLLHSSVSPISILIKDIPTLLYWNEHPTHFIGATIGISPIKRIIRNCFLWVVFLGARSSTKVMPIGEAHAQDLLEHGCDPGKVCLIYMGVDSRFQGVAITNQIYNIEAPLELFYIGTVSKGRGRDVMLEALALANSEKTIAKLTIVGASKEQIQYCEEYGQKLGVMSTLTIKGRIPGNDVPLILKGADVGLCLWEDQPWWRFNPPTKLFEYLVAGLPVLASNIRTHTEYITNWQNGLIFEYNSKSLAEAIKSLWEERAELLSLKQQALISGEKYLWNKIEPIFLKAVECN